MKRVLKYITVVLIAGGFVTSCETTDLDLQVSPNDLAADQADPNLLLNSIQLAYASNMDDLNDLGAEVTRIDYMFGRDYFNNYSGATLNGVWSRTYSSGGTIPGDFVSAGIWTNVDALIAIDEASDIDYSFHIGVGQALKAHMLMLITDYIGGAVLSQAAQPAVFPQPVFDDGPAVYAGALALLDEAESRLTGASVTPGVTDLFYGGVTEKWLKLISTLRLKAYQTTNNVSAFNAEIDKNNFISDSEDDFEFQYGSSELQPDTRHPDFAADYTPSGANIYQSNWIMNRMLFSVDTSYQDADDNTVFVTSDPRIRYYFYRQVDATPGADAPPDEETLACSLEVPPLHFQDGGFTIYCSVPNGYWGRTHGNDQGTPPDNFTRTAVGVYPAGGKFDDSTFGNVGLGEGGAGAGIEPIILASYVDFWRGDMAASDAEKAGFLRAGLEKSIAKVQEFGDLDGDADLSEAPDSDYVNTYIDEVVANFNAATGDDKENIFAEQYWITLYGGGAESYNYYRKTGYPTTLVPNWEADPGPFPRTFLLPQNEVITNPNLSQRTDLTTQVFWDTNPASPTFPPAN